MTGERFLVGTGFSSAIGQALVTMLPPDWNVLALGRTPVRGSSVDYHPVDFRQPAERWLPEVSQRLSHLARPVDGVVYMAGVTYSDAVESTTVGEWQDTLAVNLTAAFHLGQVLSPYLHRDSSVVLLGSVDAWHASQVGPAAAYGASKAGLVGLVRHFAAEWGERGVRVNGVSPGALHSGNGPADLTVELSVAQRIALGRLGEPVEVARVLVFLLSEAASYITGAWIPVDGGLNLTY